jgi:hypothetical protein
LLLLLPLLRLCLLLLLLPLLRFLQLQLWL